MLRVLLFLLRGKVVSSRADSLLDGEGVDGST